MGLGEASNNWWSFDQFGGGGSLYQLEVLRPVWEPRPAGVVASNSKGGAWNSFGWGRFSWCNRGTVYHLQMMSNGPPKPPSAAVGDMEAEVHLEGVKEGKWDEHPQGT